jgi:hypothetical protein
MISTVAETSDELHNAYKRVAAAMMQKGYRLAKQAPLHLEITLASRPASIALGNAEKADGVSRGKRNRLLQNCEDLEYRVGVTLTRIADGGEIYRGRASEHHCKVTLGEALPDLVDAALADFGRPRGSYTISYRRRE